MLCPLPIIELGKAADALAAGEEIVVRADDPAARADVAAWCRMRGHALVSAGTDDGGVSTFVVRLR
jgi:tRNA 2-thiouridine synthesizing protein A